ncbi:MAG: oxidoreductase [Actinomycetota bacterium]|nr:oxidoreductase [Actinomycetota bacterium]
MAKPTIGIFKFTSCDGCQLSIFNLEEEFLQIAGLMEIAYFQEGQDAPGGNGFQAGAAHFDLAVVEGSISTELQSKELLGIRENSSRLITIGACATAGGVQALRNWADVSKFKASEYPAPGAVEALAESTPISAHVHVDYELWGCPINSAEFSEVLASFLLGKTPGVPGYSLCMECKRKGIPCVLVAGQAPCLGPVTRAGCGVLCPSLNRACYGCFGPKEGANIKALMRIFQGFGYTENQCRLMLDKLNTYKFREMEEKG